MGTNNNLDKAMEDNPSVIECQHIARLASVRWCQCICTHSAAWRVLLCPVRSMLAGGGGLRPQQRPHGDPARPHNPWTRGDILSRRIFFQIKTRFTTSRITHKDHLCDSRMSLDFELCPDHYGPALVMVVSGVWSVESLPQRPLRPEEAGPAPVPVTSLCSVLPLCSPSPSVSRGHQEDMVRTQRPGHQISISKVTTQSSIIHGQHLRHASLVSRITDIMTHHHLCPLCPFPFFNVHFVGKRENTMIFEEKFFRA